jgi:hypothetical protein
MQQPQGHTWAFLLCFLAVPDALLVMHDPSHLPFLFPSVLIYPYIKRKLFFPSWPRNTSPCLLQLVARQPRAKNSSLFSCLSREKIAPGTACIFNRYYV